MKHMGLWVVLLLVGVGCYQRQDPVLRAAQDLERMAYDFAAEEDAQRHRLTALRLGMSDREVINTVGPPSTRQGIETGAEESREVWTYREGMRVLATLTFTNQRLVEIKVE